MIRQILRTAFEHLSETLRARPDEVMEVAESDRRAEQNDDMAGFVARPGRTEAQQHADKARAIAFRGPPGDVPLARDGNEIRMDLLERTVDVESYHVAFALLYYGAAEQEQEAVAMARRCVLDLHGIEERQAEGVRLADGA